MTRHFLQNRTSTRMGLTFGAATLALGAGLGASQVIANTPVKIVDGQEVSVYTIIKPGTFEPGSASWNEVFAADQKPARDPAPVEINLDQPLQLTATYKGKFLGFDIGRVFITADISDEAYRMTYKVETQGPTALIDEPESDALSWGTLKDGVMTSLFYYKETWDKNDKDYTELTRTGPGTRFRSWSEPQFTLYHPVMPEIALDTVDPVGALAMLGFIEMEENASPCDRTIPVYDGRRRYTMRMQDAGTKELKRRGKKRYEGFTYRCRVFMDKVAGYNPKHLNTTEEIEAYVYLAPVPQNVSRANFTYLPVLLEGRAAGMKGTIEAKDPTIIAPDGTVVKMGRS